ncbi:pyridoxamine 5'-phosphate oxidase family protein [Nonomuraea sp. NPDC050663]|uniref:pyridoxamine 5'-phosphate oxidase family protein n=1 Tax=Nonomuraea sp. NPDC050663 TaxID=3364370 RepID=UPI0037B03D8B
MSLPEARTLDQRKHDTLQRLTDDVDVWVATADPGSAEPYLIPLSFLWEDGTLLLGTDAASRTARNLAGGRTVHLSLGHTRDVIMITGTAEAVPAADIPASTGDAFAVKTGFDPREQTTPYVYFRIRPARVMAWREVNELKGRVIMRGGRWAE